MTFRLTKHHGLGNDFLVLLTDDQSVFGDRGWSARAQRWCDRTTGVGADGLLLGLRGRSGSDLEMVLHNADGSVAEMSGNGIRCLAQAEARRRGQTEGKLLVTTGGGVRSVVFGSDSGGDAATMVASVDMGPAGPGPEPGRPLDLVGAELAPAELGVDATNHATYDLGNPHLVLLVPDPSAVVLEAAGPLHEKRFDRGINVHFAAPTLGAVDEVALVTWERGVGITEACGTGASAVARAAYDWGLTGDRVTVHMPGGDAVVDVGETMVLHGPSVFVAEIEVPA